MILQQAKKSLSQALGNVGHAMHEGYTMYKNAYDASQKTDASMRAKATIRKGFF